MLVTMVIIIYFVIAAPRLENARYISVTVICKPMWITSFPRAGQDLHILALYVWLFVCVGKFDALPRQFLQQCLLIGSLVVAIVLHGTFHAYWWKLICLFGDVQRDLGS